MTRIIYKVLTQSGEDITTVADAHGNNVAFTCSCGHIVLLSAFKNQYGNNPELPRECQGQCGAEYFLVKDGDVLIIHRGAQK